MIDSCPNHAIIAKELPIQNSKFKIQYFIDARRCSSYNTIENRAETLPDELNTAGYIFGCDICQLVCPFNKDVPHYFELSDKRKQELEALAIADEQTFRRLSKHSAINRIKHHQLLRNINKANS